MHETDVYVRGGGEIRVWVGHGGLARVSKRTGIPIERPATSIKRISGNVQGTLTLIYEMPE